MKTLGAIALGILMFLATSGDRAVGAETASAAKRRDRNLPQGRGEPRHWPRLLLRSDRRAGRGAPGRGRDPMPSQCPQRRGLELEPEMQAGRRSETGAGRRRLRLSLAGEFPG
jgi:hypothetical protein